MDPTGMLCVVPSRLAVGEEFQLKVRLLGPPRPIECRGAWNTPKPALHGPFNRNVQRGIQFHDNTLPEWEGRLQVDGGPALEGPSNIVFDGENQGAFPGDVRPIRTAGPFRWTEPGFRFLRLSDPASGLEGWANATRVTAEPPRRRIYWGDPHWQTFFSDGIRCPEELYTFARDEGFLDFGAIADHVEAVTDRQWDYFTAVTNDYNAPGRFATLVGQEWTNHGPGHRNVYFRGDGGPVLRSNDPGCDTLEKLWNALDGLEALAIPHHTANATMGVDWSAGWNPDYETAVEVHSVWGSSECSAEDGNPMPIRTLGGEAAGHHVVDALRLGYRFGFVGGGDIHDGRPGDDLHNQSYPPRSFPAWPQGFTACYAPALTRGEIYDALKDRRTYGTTKSRIYLDVSVRGSENSPRLDVAAASEEGLRDAVVMRNGHPAHRLQPGEDARFIEDGLELEPAEAEDFFYVRLHTRSGHMAWSSPVWADELSPGASRQE